MLLHTGPYTPRIETDTIDPNAGRVRKFRVSPHFDQILEADDLVNSVKGIRRDVVTEVVHDYMAPGSVEDQWDIPGLEERLKQDFLLELPISQWLADDSKLYEEKLRDRIEEAVTNAYKEKEQQVGESVLRQFEKAIMLQSLDQHWKDHLAAMDHLRQGIHLRGYAQKNPKQEYKREAFEMFQNMLGRLKHDIVKITSHVRIQSDEELAEIERQRKEELDRQLGAAKAQHDDASSGGQSADASGEPSEQKAEPVTRDGRKVGRNEPCPCGSGKKYKQCHGRVTA